MKLQNFIGLFTISSMLLFSCDNDKAKDTTTTTVEETKPATDTMAKAPKTATTLKITDADVPAPVKASFTKKYPKVEKIEWSKYIPVDEEDYFFVPDTTYYYVHYNANGADYTSWYNTLGDWIVTSTPVENSAIPAPVNKTISTTYPGYEVDMISKENKKDMEMYKVRLKKGDDKVKFLILPNGEIYKQK